ncbi:ribosomal RNA large subunit methyltransferase E [Elstera cyanobacteriorum]|uniref:Ribosomal RNA large subunit methyltransferase E n=1 Tax=Elstera cyanobacteriorum TaxID=2022747 RepID=A0A255XQ28_9PROT|nr:RlmE family RNA methyltransferase [Elstera cyanobacteriorum]OYQ18555.1 23S rRNA methyltransferase [Elstera cyanobacteriorum]GFZ79432.1 ribosomal RNA large subunit methyltransferase E [Elstera cyanobacteriorum]
MTQRGKSGGGSGNSGDGGGGRRQQTVRVKTAHKRSLSSTLWLQRQLNDPYVAEAKRLGYRSRAAFKLVQLDEKFKLLGPGKRVVDLGAAPGGWTQVAIARVGSDKGRGRVVGLDILPMEPIPGADLIQADFLAPDAPDQLRALLGGGADVVMSDMAAPTTGHAKTDHLRVIALAETALMFALEVLEPGGAFVAKVFQGGSEKDLLDPLKKHFAIVRHAKPSASRADSSEMYVVATGFRRAD